MKEKDDTDVEVFWFPFFFIIVKFIFIVLIQLYPLSVVLTFCHILTHILSLQLGMCSDLPGFLHKYLERQHGDHAGDWAYSLMESIRHHLTDELISLFNDILSGKVMGFPCAIGKCFYLYWTWSGLLEHFLDWPVACRWMRVSTMHRCMWLLMYRGCLLKVTQQKVGRSLFLNSGERFIINRNICSQKLCSFLQYLGEI